MSPLTKILGASALFLLLALGVVGKLLISAHEDLGAAQATVKQQGQEIEDLNKVTQRLQDFETAVGTLASQVQSYNKASTASAAAFNQGITELRTHDQAIDKILGSRVPQPLLDRLCDSGIVADGAREAVCPGRAPVQPVP